MLVGGGGCCLTLLSLSIYLLRFLREVVVATVDCVGGTLFLLLLKKKGTICFGFE